MTDLEIEHMRYELSRLKSVVTRLTCASEYR